MTQDQILNFLQRALLPLKTRVLLMIGRAVITSTADDKDIQRVQLKALAGESMDDVEHYQNFGFTSNPPKGSEGIMVSLGGNRENAVIIALEHRAKRLKDLAAGESAVYDAFGNYLKFKANGNQEHKIKKLKIENDSDELITVIDDLFKWLEEAYVMTAMGPQQFMPADLIKLALIKERLETFKV